MRLYANEGGGRAAASLRWGLAGLLVVAAHVGAGWWVLRHPITRPAPPDTVQGIPIDLEPISVPQNAPEPNSTATAGEAPAPQAAAAPEAVPESAPPVAPPPESAATPPPEPPPPQPAPPEPKPPEPPPPVAEPPTPDPPAPAPEPPPAPTVPELQPTPEPPPIVLPQQETNSDPVMAPPPKPRPTPPKPDPRVLAREAARKKAVTERRELQHAARAEARAEARAARVRPAGGQGPQDTAPSSASSGASVSSWRGAVVAHLNSFKPAAPDNTTGTARVSFSVDRNGRVLSATLSGSSGDATLDAAAVAMVRRASPVPAPPPELGGRIALTVPVYFH